MKLPGLKKLLKVLKAFNLHYEAFNHRPQLDSMMKLSQSVFSMEEGTLAFSYGADLGPDFPIHMNEVQLKAVLVALRFFALMAQQSSVLRLSYESDALLFTLEVPADCKSFDEIFSKLEAIPYKLSADYQDRIKPLILSIITGSFNEVHLFFLDASSNPNVQLKVLLQG
jgi:hypothetical protein